MDKYLGVKMIEAVAHSKWNDKERNNHPVGWEEGYAIKYPDGYESWSPKAVFEEAYRRVDAMTFGLAIEAMKKGLAVCRKGWNGKKMWICLYIPSLNMDFRDGTSFPQSPYIVMKTADSKIIPWLASQTDMLAEDWQVF